MRIRILWAFVACAWVLAACGGAGDPVGAPGAAPPTPSIDALARAQMAAMPIAGNVASNGGFESGSTGWTTFSSKTLIGTFGAGPANTGSQYALLGGLDSTTERLSQTLTVPASAPQARLQFWFKVISTDSAVTAYDTLKVELYSASGTLLTTLATFSNLDRKSAWVRSPAYDLSAYKGQSVQLRFTTVSDISDPTLFLIDDVSVFPLDAAAIVGTNGFWWNPAESGRGFVVDRQGNQLSLGAYMYDEEGDAIWYTSLLTQASNGSWTGKFLRFSGGQTLSSAYKAPTGMTEAASVTLTFETATAATLEVQLTGNLSKRYLALELLAAAGGTHGTTFQTGTWWNESESGRGYVFAVQGNTAIVGSFMFDSSGKPVWYLGTGALSGSGAFAVDLQEFHGGQTLNGSFRAATAFDASRGRMEFTASGPTTGSLKLPNGNTVAVKRFNFNGGASDPGTGSGGGTGGGSTGGGSTGGGSTGGGSTGGGTTGGTSDLIAKYRMAIDTSGSPLPVVEIAAMQSHALPGDLCFQTFDVPTLRLRLSYCVKGYPQDLGGGYHGGYMVYDNYSGAKLGVYFLQVYSNGKGGYWGATGLDPGVQPNIGCLACDKFLEPRLEVRRLLVEREPGMTLYNMYLPLR